MRRSALLLVVALAFATLVYAAASLAPVPTASSQQPVLAIHNGRLFDGTGAPPIADGVVVIEGNRITAVGPATEVAIPAFAVTVDAAGGLIMPGVIDNHVHVTQPLVQGQGDILTPWLQAGVTTLVDTGTVRDGAVVPSGLTIPDGVALLRALIAGTEEPPRVLIAGPMLTAPGGYPATRPPPEDLAAQPVTSPDDGRERVARLIDEQGVDVIKVAIETGFDSDYLDAGWPVLPPETLAAIAEAAHERGVTVRAHVTHPGELRAALEAGFDLAAHTPTVPLPDELLQQAADAGMILVSTANIWGGAGATVAENLARYVELGGRIALGTDFPFQRGSEMPVQEMQLLVSGGLTPMDVLVAATKHGAEAFGRGDELGTLEPGKLADVIVVDGDPLSDIADMANVTTVIHDGKIFGDELPVTTAPTTGSGPSQAGEPTWPVLFTALVAGAALLSGGGLLLAARRR